MRHDRKMAAIDFDDYGDHPHGGTLATVLNWAGAFLSIALIVGLGAWGWQLWVRDVTGVPVVRALEGPMRVAPEDPGGLASEYQGLTVNRIAEERTEVAPSDQVVLAPAPATLDEGEDLAMAEMPAVPDIGAPLNLDQETEELVARLGQTEEELATKLEQVDEMVRPSVELAALDTEPVASPLTSSQSIEPTPSATDLAVAAALADIGLKPESAVSKVEAAAHVPIVTPRPQVRPSGLQQVSLAPAAAPSIGDVDPAAIASGTRLVQLGAYASPEIAEIEWAALESRFGNFMVGKSSVIQQAQAGGRSFFRLRATGFDNLSDARRFCAVMVAEGANCIPVVHD